MKKIAFVLLAGLVFLAAAEWNVEQITNAPDLWSTDPLLVLDAQGRPRILFTQWNGEVQIKVAARDTELWVIHDVATVNENFMPFYSIDVDSEANTYVAYSNWTGVSNSDIFIATDKGGSFESVNVSQDETYQMAPVLKLDRNGKLHMLYAEAQDLDSAKNLYYGWIDGDSLQRELVAQNMYQNEYLGYDLVFDQGPIIKPHAFYIGDDDCLWSATSGEPAWLKEKINELSSEWPSAVADPLGSFHVAYDVGGSSIHYISNMSGTWQDEMVSDLGTPEGGNERPVLALETVYGGYLGIGYPHIVWMHADADWWYDLYHSTRTTGPWEEEPVTATTEYDELSGYGRYFALDIQGYGHLVYCADDSNYVTQVFYAKSKEPLIKVAVSENPASIAPLEIEIEGGKVLFNLPQSSFVRISLYDVSGARIKELACGFCPSGQNEVPISCDNLPAGVYFVRGQIGEQAASAKFVVTR